MAGGRLGHYLRYGLHEFLRSAGPLDQPDPSSLPAAWVVDIKGVGFLLAILALAGSLRQAGEESG